MTQRTSEKGLFEYKGVLTLKINANLLDKLQARNLLTPTVARRLASRLDQAPWAVLQYLVRRRVIALGRLMGDRLGVAYVDLAKTLFQPRVVRMLPPGFARKNRLIPVYQLGGTVTVATCDPLNKRILMEAEEYVGAPVSPVFSLPDEIEKAVDKHYPRATPIHSHVDGFVSAPPRTEGHVSQADIQKLLADMEGRTQEKLRGANSEFIAVLESKGILTSEDSRRLVNKYAGDEWAILKHLANRTSVTAAEVGRIWGDALGVAYVDLSKTLFQAHAIRKLPIEFARKNMMIPLYQFGESVTVAMSDPLNQKVIRGAEKTMGVSISPVFSLPGEIERAIEVQYKAAYAKKSASEKITPLQPWERVRVTQAEILNMVSEGKS
jgi:hypothetical protein